jgi:SpoVK/Ycf46/Vps4 family AAA+-type ATPase
MAICIRFDREVAIDAPSVGARRAILSGITARLHLSTEVDLGMFFCQNVERRLNTNDLRIIDELAEQTNGFVGADLASLCQEAALSSRRSNLPSTEGMQTYVVAILLE